jgi:cathepsin L
LNKIIQQNQISSSSSESVEQSPNILKTKLYNPKKCKLVPSPTTEELNQFHQFTLEYNKTYSTPEEQICRTVYVIQSIREIYAHNMLYAEGKIKYGRRLNSLSDLTTEERNYRAFMTNPTARANDFEDYPELPDARESVDYRKEGLVTPVGLQLKCNSCYAWSSAAVLEGQLRKCGISKKAVSVQSMVDCTTQSSWHCKSGFP